MGADGVLHGGQHGPLLTFVQQQFRSRRVVAPILARRLRQRVVIVKVQHRAAAAHIRELRAQLLQRDGARPQQDGRLAAQVQHRRFQPDARRPAIQQQVDASLQVRQDVGRARRAGPRETVGAGGHQRATGRPNQGPRDRVRRQAQGHRVALRRDKVRQRRMPFEHEGQRARPEALRQLQRRVRYIDGQSLQLRQVGDVHDERVAGRALLGPVEAPDGVGVHGVGAEAVNRLGREGHQAALLQGARRRGDGLRLRVTRVDGQDRCVHTASHIPRFS